MSGFRGNLRTFGVDDEFAFSIGVCVSQADRNPREMTSMGFQAVKDVARSDGSHHPPPFSTFFVACKGVFLTE